MTILSLLLQAQNSFDWGRFFTVLVYVNYGFGLVTLLGMIFWEKREQTSIVMWGFILFFIPFGFVLYLIFGKGPSFGRRKKTFNALYNEGAYLQYLQKQFKEVNEAEVSSDVLSLVKFNILSNYSVATGNNRAEIFTDIEAQYERMFGDIENAKEFVNVLYFIIQPDEYGAKLRDLLAKKAEEGVKVRLVYDQVGSRKIHKRFFKKLIKAGGQVEVFFPSWLKFLNRNLNYRNHRKIVVIDNKIGYTGGANVGREYTGKHKRIRPWRDTHLRVEGEAVAMLNFRFLQDFNFAAKDREFKPFESELKPWSVEDRLFMQIVADGPDRPENAIEEAYIKAIYAAKKRIWLQTPYLIPDEKFTTAIKCAAKSGVDVRIMIPGVPDKSYAYYSTLSYAEEYKLAGVKIVLWKGFIHSKTLLIDGEISSLGTFNLDNRSFKLHFEITAFVYDKLFNEKMAEIFEEDERHSFEMTEHYIVNRPLFQRFKERLMRLLSPLM